MMISGRCASVAVVSLEETYKEEADNDVSTCIGMSADIEGLFSSFIPKSKLTSSTRFEPRECRNFMMITGMIDMCEIMHCV